MTPNEVGYAARDRAIRAIARELNVAVNLPASYEELREAVSATLDFDGDMWLCETLDMCEAVAVAEMDQNAWTDTPLPELTDEQVDAQTDDVVRKALDEDDAPAPSIGMRI